MCFSAGASFAVGASLLGPGYYAVKHTKSPGMLAFACTPIVFCFHQIAEGVLWLSLKNPDFASWYNPALYGYSFISQPIWPIWTPLVMWLMETDKRRKIYSTFCYWEELLVYTCFIASLHNISTLQRTVTIATTVIFPS
jgi:hypothetical protein